MLRSPLCILLVVVAACARPPDGSDPVAEPVSDTFENSGLEAPAEMVPKPMHVEGVQLHYVERGSGAPVILIHGSLADYTYWELSEQIPLLAVQHRVIAYSRRYNFPNENPGGADHSPGIEAHDLAGLIDHLGLDRVHLVGHSYGAYTALVFALEHPERVRSLVLAEPPIISWLPDIPGGEGIYEGFMAGVWRPLAQTFAEGGIERGLDFTARWYFGVPWEEVEPDWQTLFARNAEEWQALALSDQTYPKLDYGLVRGLTVPTLLLSGGNNSGFNRLIDGRLEQLLPNVEWVIVPGATHEMFLDDRAASASAILDFFSRN
jgi:non-heme chloroperoxidase